MNATAFQRTPIAVISVRHIFERWDAEWEGNINQAQ